MTSEESNRTVWTGIGIGLGGALGLVVGLVGWGGDGIALGMVFGACIGLVVGATADGVSRSRRPH